MRKLFSVTTAALVTAALGMSGCTQPIEEDQGIGTVALAAKTDAEPAPTTDLFCAQCFEETNGGFGAGGPGTAGSTGFVGAGAGGVPGSGSGPGGAQGSAPLPPPQDPGIDYVRVTGPGRVTIPSPRPAPDAPGTRGEVGTGPGGAPGGVELPTVHHVPCPVVGTPCMAMCAALGAPCVGMKLHATMGGSFGALRSCGAGMGMTFACEYVHADIGLVCSQVYVKPTGWEATPYMCTTLH